MSERINRRVAALAWAVPVTAVALLAAGCSSDGGGNGGDDGSSAGDGSSVVTTRDAGGVGTVFADSAGMTLYTAEQEAGGKVVCVKACLGIWKPVTLGSGQDKPSGAGMDDFATLKRPDDGRTQLTFEGRPVYTFDLDKEAGQAKGHRLTDAFGDRSFTWRAVTTGKDAGAGTETSEPPASGNQDGGYGY